MTPARVEPRYQRRILDDDLDELMPELAAIAIEGAKGVGKSATAARRSKTTLHLDESDDRQSLQAFPARFESDAPPILLDEWQRYPPSWDLVRRSVDVNSAGGRFLLTGSATPVEGPMHSGAGRIVRLRMRPLSLAERQLQPNEVVSLGDLLTGERNPLTGESPMTVEDYAGEILASGLPGLRGLGERARNMQLDGYLERIFDVEFADQGHRVRRPATLKGWLSAYAAATATTMKYNAILDAATPGLSDKPSRATTLVYRDVLERLWLLDSLPGWLPTWNQVVRLAQGPKHHLADPAFAARLLGVTYRGLLTNEVQGVAQIRDGLLLGGLFESLVTLSVRVYAQRRSATVHHLRTANGDHEVDLIVEGEDRRVVAIETKLSASVEDHDVRHLHWLLKTGGSRIADAIVVTTGKYAYRRPDGIGVVPAALLAP
jgi:uncharacterized protein